MRHNGHIKKVIDEPAQNMPPNQQEMREMPAEAASAIDWLQVCASAENVIQEKM